MESKKLIICLECGELRPRTKQHRLGRMFGEPLSLRNKKIECKKCQDFFDNCTRNLVNEMVSSNSKKDDVKINHNESVYSLKNYQVILPLGGQTVVNTGSEIQSASAGMVGVHYIGLIGSPVSLQLVDGAEKNRDKIKIINNSSDEGIIYLSVITDN